jgi:hypothetical protein
MPVGPPGLCLPGTILSTYPLQSCSILNLFPLPWYLEFSFPGFTLSSRENEKCTLPVTWQMVLGSAGEVACGLFLGQPEILLSQKLSFV